ncbi:hypothetical protein C1N55_05830 [Lysinibacillus sp. SGAir0095]|nr:hypothetical protein C1N55_05830 [Lysinibacillus sp. SGAir0095]
MKVSHISLNCFLSLSGIKKNMHKIFVQFHPIDLKSGERLFSSEYNWPTIMPRPCGIVGTCPSSGGGGADKRTFFALLGSTEVGEELAFAAGH